MIILNIEIKELIEKFDKVIQRAERFTVFTRDIELQKTEIDNLQAFVEFAEKIKSENKFNFTEEELNLILCQIISAEALISELRMLVSLKESDMDSAWGHLISAQNQTAIVASNNPTSDGSYLNGYIKKLDGYEKLLFPRMMFASTGGLIKETRCTICGDSYEECDHLKGKMYHGELCTREILKIELEEVSIVKNPANKMCRQLAVELDGKSVDVFTLKEK